MNIYVCLHKHTKYACVYIHSLYNICLCMCTSVFAYFICPILAVCYNNSIYKNALRIKNP